MNSPHSSPFKASYSSQNYYSEPTGPPLPPPPPPHPYPFPYSNYPIRPMPFRPIAISNTQSQSQQSYNSFDIKQLNSPLSIANGDEYDDDGKFKQVQMLDKFAMKKHLNQSNNDEATQQDLWNKLQKANRMPNKVKVVQHKPPLDASTNKATQNNQKNATKQVSYQQQTNELNYVEKNIIAVKNKEMLAHRFQMKSYEKLHNKQKELCEK